MCPLNTHQTFMLSCQDDDEGEDHDDYNSDDDDDNGGGGGGGGRDNLPIEIAALPLWAVEIMLHGSESYILRRCTPLECKLIRTWFNVLDAASPIRSKKRGKRPESSRFNKQWRPKSQSCKSGGLSCEVHPLLETWCHHVAWPQGQRGRFWLTAIGQCPAKSQKSRTPVASYKGCVVCLIPFSG